MTWGLAAWGLSPWGIGGPGGGAFAVAAAYTNSDRSVLVEFTVPPLQQTEIGAGDALNPATWAITSNGRALLVLVVTRFDSVSFEVRTLQLLDSWLRSVTVASSTMLDAGRSPTPPFLVAVPGVQVPPADAGDGSRYVDAANPPFVNGQPNGSLRVRAGGDFANETGPALLKKLVLRFLQTSPGELDNLQDYGLGARIKEPVSTSDLVRLRTRIEQGLLRWIPGAVEAGARLEMGGGVLNVQAAVKTSAGETISETTRVVFDGGVQL